MEHHLDDNRVSGVSPASHDRFRDPAIASPRRHSGLSWQLPAHDESEAPYENDHISRAVLHGEFTAELH